MKKKDQSETRRTKEQMKERDVCDVGKLTTTSHVNISNWYLAMVKTNLLIHPHQVFVKTLTFKDAHFGPTPSDLLIIPHL